MAKNIKSFVYQDTVIQKILKDALIPILGYRDTSKRLGEYTQEIDDLKNRVKALEIPDKSKIYIHDNMNVPIFVEVPNTSYSGETSFYEPVMVEVEVNFNGDAPTRLCAGVIIPAMSSDSSTSAKPFVVYCNQASRDVLKTVVVNVRRNSNETPSLVYEIYFPSITEDNSSSFGRTIVTISSEHREVRKDTVWTDETIDASELLSSAELILGVVAIEDPIPNPDKLVYSDNIRAILSITKGAYQYLNQTDQTVPTTLYLEREDKSSRNTGRLFIRSADEIKNNYDVLVNIFGKDWSGLEFEFDETLTDITGCFEGLDIDKTPKALISKYVTKANNLFKNSTIKMISSQDTLLSGMPFLQSANDLFNGCVNMIGDIKEELISKNLLLDSIERAFKNTKVTNTFEIWNYTHTYQPEKDPSLPPSYPNPDPVTIYLNGRGCFEGVTTLTNINDVPVFWKTNSLDYEYKNSTHFMQFRDRLLMDYNNNLSTISITFTSMTELDNMFSSTSITHTPRKVISNGATSAISMFGYCSELIQVSAEIISHVPTLTDISGFVSSAEKLTSLPEELLYENKAIANYSFAFNGLTSMTGNTPKAAGGINLWEVAGTEGFPSEISGLGCFTDSTFDDITTVPVEWGGRQ